MKNIFLGNTLLNNDTKEVKGQFVEIENEKFYKISNYDQMPDFFMTIVSDSDHWMYLSSNGALSAGRKNRNNALFPYYTVDKIHDYRGKTGSKTICLIEKENKTFLWEPFTGESEKVYQLERNVYKNIFGNKVVFEEINLDLGLSFRYSWNNSERYGWVKKSAIRNISDSNMKIDILDGIQNILPYGIDYAFQNEYSNLSDAYKKNELLKESGLGLFMLSSIPVDRAEPSEALKTTTVWSCGLPKEQTQILISDKQLDSFRKGLKTETEIDIRASRGAFYLNAQLELKADTAEEWVFAAEVNQDATDVANLDLWLKTENNPLKQLIEDIDRGTYKLKKIVASADGMQLGNEALGYARHFSNTLYNIMRGGIFADNYNISTKDFRLFVGQSNKTFAEKFEKELLQLPENIQYNQLVEWSKKISDTELERICYEYLPLTFSRRHGDPSRPWNQFSIETKNEDGTDKLNYQGNWRDIFQNWEALAVSFPEYLEGMISKFLNASTADGYNPYRITREGIDWEAPDPHDPWAYIGYWGDHQIIYLQKLLEQSDAHYPGKLDELLTHEIFVYANVPYRIKPFDEIVKNPQDTILFDSELHKKLLGLADEIGADGKLLRNTDGELLKANLTEKILVTLLAKMSNFIPEAGIWLNTQRPEWNDANNALVGNGVSMVTLYYIRRFLKFWEEKFDSTSIKEIAISEEIKFLFDQTFSLFAENTEILKKGFSNEERYHFTKVLGKAGENYREEIYNDTFSGKKTEISVSTLKEFCALLLKYINQSIEKNKREDGLYHAYNLIEIKGESISIRYLYEMLEGQVAVLSSGYLTATESLDVLNALKASALFREDQYSYILYPDRQLPRFEEKNNIPEERIKQSELLQKLLLDSNLSIVKKDELGAKHFDGTFRNADELEKALNQLPQETYGLLLEKEKELILDIYEEMFDHQSFTGRSGTFYGYEGLGSIYWHMVSKLLLAVQECYFSALEEKAKPEILGEIKNYYYEIKAGIGLYKSPDLYGAFPTDAYSHTPGCAGVKQPGLTGQVKEDVISRFGELGIHVKEGKICFNTSLMNHNDIMKHSGTFSYFLLEGKQENIELKPSQLAFTFCQVPVVYSFGEEEKITIIFKSGKSKEISGNVMDKDSSLKIFSRSREVSLIEYYCQ